MIVTDNRKLFAIKEEFNIAFPYLKLEFFSKPNKGGNLSSIKLIKLNCATLGECSTNHTKGKIIITPQMTVVDLEQKFTKEYGLGIQVFRKSGKAWLETTLTDGWTLEEQNREGEALSRIAV